jgi:spermidine synthase
MKPKKRANASWIHPALYRRKVRGKGWGVFSKEHLRAGTIAAVLAGGKIITTREARKLWEKGDDHFQQVHKKLFWTPDGKDDVNEHDMTNHSCDPNMWLMSDQVRVLRRDVRPRVDEITWDYATTESMPWYGFRCKCGSKNCRGRVAGNDWELLELQLRYFPDHFSPYLRQKINELLKKRHLAIDDGMLFFEDSCDPHHRFRHRVLEILADHHSPYQHVQIFLTPYGEFLALDGFPQIAKRDRSRYTEAMVGVPLLTHPSPRRILFLGSGDGDGPRIASFDRRVEEMVIVDIDRKVVELTQRHMPDFWGGVQNDSRVKILNCDALVFLRDNREPFDVIISDLTDFDEGTASQHLFGENYFREIRRNLCDHKTDRFGVFVIQAGELTEHVWTGHKRALRLVKRFFKNPDPQPFSVYIPSFSSEWSFVIAATDHLLDYYKMHEVTEEFARRKELAGKFEYLNPDTFLKLFALDPAIRKNLSI